MHPRWTAIAVVLVATGCSSTGPTVGGSSQPPADPDGVSCQDSAGATAVHIDVEYHGNGVSTPTPICTVDAGTRITWRARVGSTEAFQLQFAGVSPGGRGAPRVVDSSEHTGRQTVAISADNVSGTYDYEIHTRHGGIDPAIIIR